MLKGGITCFNDMYFFPRATAEAAIAAHLRAVIGLIAIEFPTGYASDAEDYLNKGLAVRDDYRNEELVSFAMAPHAPYTVSDRTFERMVTYAEQLNIPIHVHVHETRDEISQSQEQHGQRPLARLERLGLLGPNLIAVHTVHLAPEEIAILARQGCHAAHCPSSNLKLASGIAPVAHMLDAGINVGLGTDGCASNNRLDLFEEMRLAALLAKGVSGQAEVLPAHQTLAMATLGGARALGLDRRIGSLVPGKAADLTAVELTSLETLPCYDPVSHLVYAAGREQVSHVWVGGRAVLEDRRLTTLDPRDLATRALRWQEAVARSDAEANKP
jgi:5-methylthioadenosine/S-adenosylhomocysteine deaminase